MLSSKARNSPRILRCIRISWKWSVSLTGQWWGRGLKFKMLWVGYPVYVFFCVIGLCTFYFLMLPCFPRRRVLWEYFWVIQYLVNSGKMRERFHLRQISKPVRESLLGRSKSREGYWRSVFEDSHVAPCLTFLHDKQQVPNQRHRDKAPLRKFSTMIKRMVVELDRDPALYSDGNIVEVSVFFFLPFNF